MRLCIFREETFYSFSIRKRQRLLRRFEKMRARKERRKKFKVLYDTEKRLKKELLRRTKKIGVNVAFPEKALGFVAMDLPDTIWIIADAENGGFMYYVSTMIHEGKHLQAYKWYMGKLKRLTLHRKYDLNELAREMYYGASIAKVINTSNVAHRNSAMIDENIAEEADAKEIVLLLKHMRLDNEELHKKIDRIILRYYLKTTPDETIVFEGTNGERLSQSQVKPYIYAQAEKGLLPTSIPFSNKAWRRFKPRLIKQTKILKMVDELKDLIASNPEQYQIKKQEFIQLILCPKGR
ncbi:MAG: hypothetical protein FWC00_01715 [Firmicutes bacterium]|nr:hypothetical protein [Bacillota bacterium]